ncbi:flagellar transcriptional regulator FlhD [Paraburkholderia sp. BCC1886]|uniref:flagellar transcriptional regulator FlhD n=1 Tax=Paraburkholderia sp. BCC1886 TaxID=2562670 RepID=UPI001182D66F|nr:flagellar transcriptional regulator FlhD [Paraburkholderia sp. BCC1886]
MAEQSDIETAIFEFNKAYLLLAQRMLAHDRDVGKQMLGISEPIAKTLVSLTPAEMEALSDSTSLVCELRLDKLPGSA